MKRTLYGFVCALLVVAVSCNYDDKSTGEDAIIPDIKIDTTGIPDRFTVNFGERLVIEPKVSSESNPEGDFSYEWRLGLRTSDQTTTMVDVYKIAGTEEKLDYLVADLKPDALTYQLWYRVKDNKNGQMRTLLWQVLVNASSGQGLLLAHSTDGETSDLAVIQDTLFTRDFDRFSENGPGTPTLVKDNLYSTANGEKWPGIIKELFFQPRYQDGALGNFVDGHSGTGMFRLNTLSFSLDMKNEEMFYMPTTLDIRKMFAGNNYTTYTSNTTNRYIWNDHSIQLMEAPRATDSPYLRCLYTMRNVGSLGAGGTGLAVTHDPNPHVSQGLMSAVFYDDMNGRFMYISQGGFADTDEAKQASKTDPAAGFDSRDIPGLEILHGEYGNSNDHRFIAKHEGEYKIFSVLDREPAVSRTVININDAPEIDKALYFVCCNNQPAVYYATSTNKVYSILFLAGMGEQVTYTLRFTSPDPINGLYLARKGGTTKTFEYDRNALLMTTTTGQSEGKVWVLPMETIGDGSLNTEKVVSFGGFGRISALVYID